LIARCLSLLLLLVLVPSSYAKVKRQAASPDVPSGFFPGAINYFAGNGTTGTAYSDGSIPTQVQLAPGYTVTDSQGNVYIATSGAIYMVYSGKNIPQALKNVTTTPQAGRIYQVAGIIETPCEGGGDPTCGEGQPLNQVLIGGITGFTIDSSDNLYYSDSTSDADTIVNVVRKVNATTSVVTTIAGQLGVTSSPPNIGDGGPATSATLNAPTDVKVDSHGNVFINDFLDDVIRVVYSGSQPPPILAAEGTNVTPAQAGYIYTVAGQVGDYCTTVGGCGDGTSATTSASLANEESIAIDAAGNLYIADTFPGNSAAYIRLVYAGGAVPALLNLALNPGGGNAAVPTNGYIYAVTGYGLSSPFSACMSAPCGNGGLAANMQFGYSVSQQAATLFLVLDASGNLYIADEYDFAVRKIDASGYASTIAGVDQTPSPNPPASQGGPATSTNLTAPSAISFDATGNLYIVDADLVWLAAPLQGQTISFPAFDPATVTYGVSPITLAATASSGLPVTYSVTSGPGAIKGSQLSVTGAGTIVVAANQAGNGQYSAASVSRTLTVDPAPLTVTANSVNKVFGAPNPVFTATITGLVNGDTSSAYTGAPAFSTTATTNSPQGMYPITVSIGSLASANYAFTDFVPGTLTIGGNTPQSITFPPLTPITYGQVTTLNLVATASSGLPVTLQVVSGPGTLGANGTTLTITGGGTIVITATQPGADRYEPATPVTQSLVVNPAPLTVTGPSVTLGYGVPVNTTTFPAPAITGFVGGDTQASVLTGQVQYTTLTGVPGAGTYPIYVGLGTLATLPAFSANYVILPVNGQLIVQKPGDGELNPAPGDIYYFAGNGPNLSGTYLDGSVPILVPIPNPTAVAVDGAANTYFATSGTIYVVYAGIAVPATLANITATPLTGRIYQITGLVGICGNIADRTCGEGMTLNLASFGRIAGMAFDSANNLYISDGASDVIRRVDAASSIVTTVAGQLNTPSSSTEIGDGGRATSATLSSPADIKVDSFGNFYFGDQSGSVARVVYAAGATAAPPVLAAEGITGTAAQAGNINTIAGHPQQFCADTPSAGSSGSPGACGDFGAATGSSALFLGLDSLAVDPAGNIYFADAHSGSNPKAAYLRALYVAGSVPPLLGAALNGAAPTAGDIYAATGYSANTHFALCAAAPCGDGGPAASMQFGASSRNLFLTQDTRGNLYVADSGDWAVRKISTSAIASTVAGIDNPNQTPPANPPAAQGNPATATQLSNFLYAIAIDAQGNLYIADTGDDLVWQVSPLLEQFFDFPAFNPSTVSYGTSPIALSATASSGLPVSFAVSSGPGAISGSQLTVTGAGMIVVAASQAGNGQYSPAPSQTQSLTVSPVPLTVTANNATRVYGTPNPAFTATFTGFVNSDSQTTPGIYTGSPAFSTAATTNSPQGSYPITVSLGTLASTDYTFGTFAPGTLTVVGNQTQTITFAPLAAVTYGQPTSLTLSATASSGLPVTYQVVSGPGSLAANGTTLNIAGAGTIVITASQPGSGPYLAATSVTRSLVVNPAALTVTGPTVTLQYGATVDPSTFPPATITGFVGSDTQASVLTGSAQYTTVTGTPNAGTYPISVGLGTLALVPAASANYVLSAPVNGSLIVEAAAQVINLNPVPSSQIYGNFVPLTAVATSGLPVVFTVSGPGRFYNGINTTIPPASTTVQLVLTGVGTVTVTATQAGGGNYQSAPPLTQTFTVGQAPLNIGVAINTPVPGVNYIREQGAPNPVFQPTIGVATTTGGPGGFVNGDSDIPSVISGIPVLTTSATQSSAPGDYAIVPSQGTLSAANYYLVYVNGTLEITPPGSFAITASPSSLTIPSGLSAQSTLTLTPSNYYQGTVTVSCGQVPANVTCVVSPSTYVFPGAQANGATYPAQGTVTITASSATVVGAARGNNSISRAATLLVPGALAGLLIAFARKRAGRPGSVWGAVALLALGAGTFVIASCGGNSNSLTAAPGTTTVMITGAGTSSTGNAAVTSSVPLTVTIQ
jgi:hypothetical protein